MKITKSLIAYITLSLFLLSCGNSSHDTVNHEEHDMETTVHKDHEHDSESETIQLNEGAKWTVNAEMTPFVEKAETILANYQGEDYKSLAEKLSTENSSLISSCTMDGKSHDELHKWLHPHLELVKALKSAENVESANVIITELKESFSTYHTYFE